MHCKLAADTRRRYIEYIVDRHTGVTNPNWWGPPYPEQKDKYQEWALARVSSLRAELEAKPDDALLAELDRCNKPRERECINFMLEEFQQQEQQADIGQRASRRKSSKRARICTPEIRKLQRRKPIRS